LVEEKATLVIVLHSHYTVHHPMGTWQANNNWAYVRRNNLDDVVVIVNGLDGHLLQKNRKYASNGQSKYIHKSLPWVAFPHLSASQDCDLGGTCF
jgi:hypothetical protein